MFGYSVFTPLTSRSTFLSRLAIVFQLLKGAIKSNLMYTLVQLRKSHNLTQAQLASRLDVHRPQVVAWEKGTDAIGIKTARRIMESFDVVATLDLESKSFTFMPVEQWRKLQPTIEQMERETDMMWPDA